MKDSESSEKGKKFSKEAEETIRGDGENSRFWGTEVVFLLPSVCSRFSINCSFPSSRPFAEIWSSSCFCQTFLLPLALFSSPVSVPVGRTFQDQRTRGYHKTPKTRQRFDKFRVSSSALSERYFSARDNRSIVLAQSTVFASRNRSRWTI